MADRRTVIAAWFREVWINARYDPARLVLAVHFAHKPLWWADMGMYRCTRCGSCSGEVQAKGRRKAEAIRRQFA